jgi:hypothetical protein
LPSALTFPCLRCLATLYRAIAISTKIKAYTSKTRANDGAKNVTIESKAPIIISLTVVIMVYYSSIGGKGFSFGTYSIKGKSLTHKKSGFTQ